MPNDPHYEAVLERAKVHLELAWAGFINDKAIPWGELTGNVPKVRVQVWIDALKSTIPHYEEQERWLSL